MTVAIYAALLGLWLVILSVRVIALRGNPVFRWFAFSAAHEDALPRAIRGQGNLTEYAPIFLLLMLIAESAGIEPATLHWYGMAFLAGRLMHGICFGFMHRNMVFRVGGTVLTLFSILGLSLQLALAYFR